MRHADAQRVGPEDPEPAQGPARSPAEPEADGDHEHASAGRADQPQGHLPVRDPGEQPQPPLVGAGAQRGVGQVGHQEGGHGGHPSPHGQATHHPEVPQVQPGQHQADEEGHRPAGQRVGPGDQERVQGLQRRGGQPHPDPRVDAGADDVVGHDPDRTGDEQHRGQQDEGAGAQAPHHRGEEEQQGVGGQDHAHPLGDGLQTQPEDEEQQHPPGQGPPQHPPGTSLQEDPHPQAGHDDEQHGGPPERDQVETLEEGVGVGGAGVDDDHADDRQAPGRVQPQQPRSGCSDRDRLLWHRDGRGDSRRSWAAHRRQPRGGMSPIPRRHRRPGPVAGPRTGQRGRGGGEVVR